MLSERTRRVQRIEELTAAALRALSGETEVRFRGHLPHLGDQPIPLPAAHLQPCGAEEDARSLRGVADGLALRLRYSDPHLGKALAPEEAIQRSLFEQLEQFRVESLAPRHLPGLTHNLRERFHQWSVAVWREGWLDTGRGLLLYTVAQVCRARITGQPVVADTEDLIESTRASLAPRIGSELAALRRERGDQRTFALPARKLAATVAEMLDSADVPATGTRERDDTRVSTLLVDFDSEQSEGDTRDAVSGGSRPTPGLTAGYRVFTTAYDREDNAHRLVRPELLHELRQRLDWLVAEQRVNRNRLVRDLSRLLSEPVWRGWDSDREEGQVDGKTLARLITSPTERRLFRSRRDEPVADALVTFLIDCSGSMKQHAELIAVLVDVLTRALEHIGARCEVLGFTTAAWNGGRARRDWLRAGRPAVPGRLNERRHVVFKDAATPWRRGRHGLAALLKQDLFREGIDGEAVLWALNRTAGNEHRRKVLVVMSDGSPMDAATSLANGPDYLDGHLGEVVRAAEAAGHEIVAAGVGLDLSASYSRCRILDTASGTGYAPLADLIELLAGR